MKLCLMILSVPWYMFNGRLEHTAILSYFLTFITGTGNDTPEINTWLNLQKIGCVVIWKGAGHFVTW
jgi:hypothetical protein